MIKRIFRFNFISSLIIILTAFLFLAGTLYNYFTNLQMKDLEVKINLIEFSVLKDGVDYLKTLNLNDSRITWIDKNGKVLYDNRVDESTMENHLSRQEVKDALNIGTGKSSRLSITLTTKNTYYAKKIKNGTVIRMSYEANTILNMFGFIAKPMLFVFIFELIFSLFLASKLSKRFLEPINSINLDNPLDSNTYEELTPLLTRIEQQNRLIKKQMNNLQKSYDEFLAITSSMNEGILLLDKNGDVVSINKRAVAFFEIKNDAKNSNILTINRSVEMQKLLENTTQKKHTEIILGLRGRKYQVVGSPILSDGELTGIAILMFDITEKAEAVKMRREFTANVSHELKTPIQSIMGSAEIMKNGLVSKKDMSHFLDRIFNESKRLVTLIDDIIRLSRLDEKIVQPPLKNINLKELVNAVCITLEKEAQRNFVTINIFGEKLFLKGIYQLIWEILYNLTENAIKYNKKNGRIDITFGEEHGSVFIMVSDTGIGIPKEEQNRIFERFYRVDKSHSKETGGTGLGLSIVKHAAEYMNAKIEIVSEESIGTSIKVIFLRDLGDLVN